MDTENNGEQRLLNKLANMKPGKSHMIANGYRVQRDREPPYLFRFRAPSGGWSYDTDPEGILKMVKDHYLNPDLLWD